MNTRQVWKFLAWLMVLQITSRAVCGQSTLWTYQGRLTVNNVPPAGSNDLIFTLYDAASGGTKLSGPLTNTAAPDANGVLTIPLDFGNAAFNGSPRWLEIGARPAGGGPFTTLMPRQPLTPSPYALYAMTPAGPAGTPGSVWREGSGAPTNSVGIDGDYYLNGSTGEVYQRVSGNYTLLCNIKGPQGPVGVALPFHGVGATNIPLFEVDNSGGGNGLTGMTGTGYGVFGQANSAGGWGGLFRYGSDGNNSAYLGANGSAGTFYGPVTISGTTGNTLFHAANAGTGDAGLFDGVVQINGTLSASSINSGEIYAYNTNGDGYGIKGYGNNIGVFAENTASGIAVYLATGGLAGDFYGDVYVHGTVTQTSDRNTKENFAPIDTREILEKVARLPLESWNYKGDAPCRHLGPMAQDFRAAFALGLDDKSICSVDADGVALAAIQALNKKIEEKDAQIESLKQRLDGMERLLNRLADSQAQTP